LGVFFVFLFARQTPLGKKTREKKNKRERFTGEGRGSNPRQNVPQTFTLPTELHSPLLIFLSFFSFLFKEQKKGKREKGGGYKKNNPLINPTFI